MNETEARALVAVLTAAFPRQVLEQPTLDLYASALRQFESPSAAARAVETVVGSAHAFPTVASLRETYFTLRKREVLDEEHTRRERELESGETTRELPAEVRDYLTRLQLRGMGRGEKIAAARIANLPIVGHGPCSDCKQEAKLAHYGSLELCARCVGRRIGVAVKAEESERLAKERREAEVAAS